ncbi:hypothetical protein B0A55_12479 [Friedmanniomyces simplex]|uniref:Uncharacterized protein n=1 Tax=Friedmanniomyces simplex TaxID=329884 RepID=A0A4U0W4Z7_9PEZI|nr:hypothetical protein B0A55_12479 [Friedmanniomyces simplex]
MKSTPRATTSADEPVRCCCDACVKGYTSAGADCDSPFLRMPREVCDKIYQELLLAKLFPAMQIQYDQVKTDAETPLYEYGRENALDYFEQEIAIMPGAEQKYRYRFIVDAMGLVLANKQIHAEASSILFGKNTFFILPEWERVHSFWRCDRSDCEPRGKPCYIMLHNLTQIKHLSIVINNARQLSDPMLRVEAAKLLANIKNVVDCFQLAGNKLKTLKIRYTSSFEGQIGSSPRRD